MDDTEIMEQIFDFVNKPPLTDEEFRIVMKNRGFTEEEIQRDIDDYHAMINNPEYLKETPNLKELLPINCFVRKPVDTSEIINEVGFIPNYRKESAKV